MSTDKESTQETDSLDDHQSQEEQNDSSTDDHQTDSEKEGGNFDARTAFNKTNERLNRLSEKLESFDPQQIAEIAKRLDITKEEAREEVNESSSSDVDSIVEAKLWQRDNASRIAAANKDGAYDKYVKEGIRPEYALRLAEDEMGILVDTTSQDRQQRISSANSSVDRDVKPKMPDSLKGVMTEKEFEKYQKKAQGVQIIR